MENRESVSIPIDVLQRANTIEDVKEWLRLNKEEFKDYVTLHIPDEDEESLAVKRKIKDDLASVLKEREAYLQMEDKLHEKYLGKFVAIANGKLIGVGDDKIELIMRLYREIGYQPMYVHQVGAEERIIQMNTPHIVQRYKK